jgi:hypothetical protein
METPERLGRIEERLDSLCKVLLDNGQPGAISRISKLERWRSYITGALVVIVFLLTAAVTIGGVLLATVLKR